MYKYLIICKNSYLYVNPDDLNLNLIVNLNLIIINLNLIVINLNLMIINFRENLEKQLHKIDGLIFFPNLSLSDLEFSYNPPKILAFLKPVQDNLGLWMCMSAEHVGLSSVVLNFDGRPPHLLQDDIRKGSFKKGNID